MGLNKAILALAILMLTLTGCSKSEPEPTMGSNPNAGSALSEEQSKQMADEKGRGAPPSGDTAQGLSRG